MTTERINAHGAIDENRTRNPDLEGQCFTIKLLLHSADGQLHPSLRMGKYPRLDLTYNGFEQFHHSYYHELQK